MMWIRNSWCNIGDLMVYRTDWFPDKERLRLIFSTIPEIDCPDDCSLCCTIGEGMIIWPDLEAGYQHLGNPAGYGCDRLIDGRCEIYNDRPFICRILYKTKGMPKCCMGEKSKKMMTKEQTRQIIWCFVHGTLQDAKALKARWR